ncbi:MAG: ABC transporter substrate-binding protein [Bacilli bacterium]
MKTRKTRMWAAAGSVTAVLGVLSTAVPTMASTSGSALPHLSYKGTITMYAQSYTPAVKGVYQNSWQTIKLHAFEQVAQAFEKLYPGIHIKFVNSNTYGSTQWYETEAAAGLLPDVTWVQNALTNSVLPKGVYTNLAPYFAKPNPFIPGNKKWSSIMNSRILETTKAPNGAQYVLDGDWVATAFYYNINLFKKAGITTPPKTWAQLIKDSKILKAHGIVPGAIDSGSLYGWWNRIFNTNAVGQKKLNALLAIDHSVGIVSSVDEVKGYEQGLLNPAKNPALTAWWPAVKNLMSLWDKSVLEVPINNTNPSAPETNNYFAAQKIAMAYDGSWLPPIIHALPKNKLFPVGAFTIDNLTGTSKYATSLVTSQDVGGPNAAFQYGVATQQSDHSMTPQKLKAVIAWMQFFGTPRWDGTICDELGSFIPTFKGAKPTPSEAGIVKDFNKPFYALDLFENLTPQAATQTGSLFQEYVTGHLSLQSAQQQYSQIAAQAVQQYKVKNNIS